uniref:Integrase, catalytic region, zinc finger, CCHC-type, peptidase aspartic, catalytic n=1 Tax=Tanacetum cinerariifolium TaxID=118510 RepID=A0A6L2MGD6_TANCI|nr:integrase, catalytic region, zinc finger, CCHC-type, peptidase aspartic, catalytic [Tanacetum cinerariifolium]
MSTQQDIYASGSESHHPMLNKENYVPWSSLLLRYAKSRPNGKLIHNSIINGPYVRRMIPEPGDTNREVPVNETFHVQTDDELTEKELKQIEADDQAIQTILLGLPEDIYAAIDSCETAQEIWLRVQQMMKGSDIGIQEKKAKLFNEWEMFTSNEGELIESYYHRFLKLMNDLKRNKHLPEKIARNLNGYNAVQNIRNLVAQNLRVQNVGNLNGLIGVPGNVNQTRNGNLGAARAEGNAAGQNGNQIRCYNCRGVGHFARNYTVRPRRRDAVYLQTQLLIAQKEEAGIQLQAEEFDLMATATDLDEIEEVNANCILMANLQQASTSGTQTDRAPVYDSDGSAEVHDYDNCDDNVIFNMFTQEEQYTELLEPIPDQHQVPQNDNNVISEVTSVEQSGKTVEQHPAHFEETPKFVGDFKSLAKEADESLAKHKALELEIERLLRAVVSQDIMSVMQNNSFVDTSNLQTELERTKEHFEKCIIKKENEYAKLWNDWYKKCDECKYDKISYDKAYKDMQQKFERLQAQLEDLKGKSKDTSCVSDTLNPLSQKLENENDNTRGTSKNTKFSKQSILEKPPMLSEIHALSKPVTSNSVPTPQESKVVKNNKVIALGMFRINTFKTSREEKHVPKNVRASARTKPITVSQPLVFTKKDVYSDSNGLSSTGIDNTKTRRLHPRSNTKNDKVPSASKSSRSKNKEIEVEEHHRNLLLSKKSKHMLSACNNFKLDSQNVYFKLICATCKQCLISVNHDECLLNYVHDKNSHGKKQMANDSIKEKQMKRKPKVKKPKKAGFIERIATPKPSKPRYLLRWSPTRRMFDLNGKIIASSESKSQSDYSKGDNACTSNLVEPTIKRLPIAIFSLAGNSNMFMVRRLELFQAHDQKSKASHQFRVEVYGNCHNLFSVGQFCDLDLEVAFRRNACFVRNLKGVDLLKGDHSTNLYTINLHEMDSASPICLMACATFTKSWLWHQRLSHLNFDNINDLVSGLPKFKYHKEHLCPSCEQGKSKRASHSPKPVPNSRQRLHLLHIDLCGPMRIASINRKRTKKIMETINVSFDELSAMAFEQCSSKPGLQSMTSGQISSGLDLTYAPSTITTQQPTEGELDLLFEAMYDDYIGGQPSATARTVLAAQEPQVHQTSTASTSIADTTPTPTNSSSHATKFPINSQDVDELNSQQQHVQQ